MHAPLSATRDTEDALVESRTLIRIGALRRGPPIAMLLQSLKVIGVALPFFAMSMLYLVALLPALLGAFVSVVGNLWLMTLFIVGAIALVLGLMALWSKFRPSRWVEVDESGVRIFRGKSVRYLSFGEIGGTMISNTRTPGTPSWLLWAPDGTVEVLLPLTHLGDVESGRHATSAIRVRAKAAPDRHSETRQRLRKGEQSQRVWIESLKHSAAMGAYRGLAWDEEALWDILDDPCYPHVERASAAVVLRYVAGGQAAEALRAKLHEGTALPILAWLHLADPAGEWLPKGIRFE